jgi:hypothetical protein
MEATEGDRASFLPYDIVEMKSNNEGLDGRLAYITKIPLKQGGGKEFLLWYPGDPDNSGQSSRLVTYRIGSQESDVTRIILQNRPDDASIQRAIQAEIGRYIIGVPTTDYLERHVLRVIRVEPGAIYCVRQGDLAEKVIRIPLGDEGIGDTSPYVFLMPAETREANETDKIVTRSSDIRDAEINRLRESENVTILREDLPEYIVREETIRTGGTRDTERLRGQIVAAVGAIGRGSSTEHSYTSERIKDLILRETREDFGGRVEIFNVNDPVLLRIPSNNFPEWTIPIDGSRKEEVIHVTKEEVSPGHYKYIGIPPPEATPESKKYKLRENITHLRRQLTLLHGSGEKVTKPTPYILTEGADIFVGNSKHASPEKATFLEGKYPVLRTATQGTCIMKGGEKNTEPIEIISPDYIKSVGTLILPLRYYLPESTPLVEGVRIWTRSLPSTKLLSKAVSPSGLATIENANDLLDIPNILNWTLTSDIKTLKDVVSFPLHNVIKTLDPVIAGGRDETSARLETFGFTHHVITHQELRLLSNICENTFIKTTQQRSEIVSDESPLRIPRPDALFKDRSDLRAAYPQTMGLIGPWEAFHRITSTPGDYGSLLYNISSINEYGRIKDLLISKARESEGKRSHIRAKMASIQDELNELDGQLKTLDNIAKHYESRKDVDKDNKAAQKGKIILWDESRDTDVMKHLYNGERLRKITGALLTKKQKEGTLPIDTTEDDILRTDSGTNDICPQGNVHKYGGIDEEEIIKAVREDINAYNMSIPRESRMSDERVEEIIQRVFLGGRPVSDGDVALITRHLRTAAYTWNDTRKKWSVIKGEILKSQGGDITIENIRKTGKASVAAEESAAAAAKVSKSTLSTYSKTLELNRQYRALSKTKDDLELASNIPGMQLNGDDMDEALTILFERGRPIYEKRRGCVQNNRILDEAPFIYDMLNVMLRRRVDFQDDEDSEEQRHTMATIADLRNAKLSESLVIDEDQAMYERGFGAYDDIEKTSMEQIPKAGFIPDESLITDPRIIEASDRNKKGTDAIRFIKRVKTEKDKLRRYCLLGMGMIESILGQELLADEVAAMVSEVNVIVDMIYVPKSGSKKAEAIVSGAVFCMLLLMTRSSSEIHLKTIDGNIPPPARHTVPSYFYHPVKSGDDERMATYLYGILHKISSIRSGANEDLPEFILSKSKIFKEHKKNDVGLQLFSKLASQLARSSPAIVDRSFKAQREINLPRTIGEIMTNRALRRIGLWESLPVGYRPSPGGKLMIDGKRVLLEETPLNTDPFGVPIRENAAIRSPIQNPSLRDALLKLKRERAEALSKTLYTIDKTIDEYISNTILNAPAYNFIGIPRKRIDEVGLHTSEGELMISKSTPITLPNILSTDTFIFKDVSDTQFDSELDTYVKEICEEAFGINNKQVMETLLQFGNGSATLDSQDANGSMRAELIAVHDAILMAIEEIIINVATPRRQRYTQVFNKGGSYSSTSAPIYGIYNRVKPLMKGIDPKKIESTGRLAVLTGKNSYYARVDTVRIHLSETCNINTEEYACEFRNMIRNIKVTIQAQPDRIPRHTMILTILKLIHAYLFNTTDNHNKEVSAKAYLKLLSHRYRSGKSGVINELMKMAADYTDVTPSMISEEANKDREMERQSFIYRLDGLDQEQKKISKALQSLGLTLEGRVAADPTRFNAEYYEQQTDIVGEREIRMREEGEDTDLDQVDRTPGFGDQVDADNLHHAAMEATTEVDQIEGIDYDE